MHDYQISWDYMLDDYISVKDKKLINKFSREFKKTILPLLNSFKSFKIEAIILANCNLGVYCKGTYSKPIIGIDIGNIKEACEEYNVDYITGLKTTILHELKHAWQEYNNLELDEEEAEEFAYQNS